jgi:hypothetical protein
MTRREYLELFALENEVELKLTTAKNTDYADSEDPFQNFRNVEQLGLCSVEVGILTRMSDKLQRVCNLQKRDPQVADESASDTLRDLSIYAKILRIYIKQKKEPRRNAV